MSIAILSSPRARHQLDHQEALHRGLTALGKESYKTYSIEHTKAPVVACWGWRAGKYLRDAGSEVLVMERGYLGDRMKNTSLAWNGLNGHADFPEYPCDGGERFRRLGIELKPWRGGSYALILGQVPKDASLKGVDMVPWYEEKAREIREAYGIPVYFRPHPDLKRQGISQNIFGAETIAGSLSEALSGAIFTVCFNSNSAVDSIIEGVPCVAGDKGTMAFPMCSVEIKTLVTPDREKWVWGLAQKQWTLDEIASGEALCKLGL